MFNYKHYVPILKAKEGEFKALAVTSSGTKSKMTPLLEIVKITWDYKKQVESKTLDNHLNKLGKNILDSWGSDKIFVDSPFLDEERTVANFTHHLIHLFTDFRLKNLHVVPTTGLSRHIDYKNAVKTIISSDKRGICLRLKNSDLTNPELKTLIDNDLAFYGIKPTEVDLIMDLGSISNPSDLLPLSISLIINTKIPHINHWRTFTLSATAFPLNLALVSSNSIDKIERSEWLVWEALLASELKRKPTFGDYAISHPDMVDMNPMMMTMGASIRYTANDYWLIVKGRSIKTTGFIQYHSLASTLITRPEYTSPSFSWGDDYINNCALKTVGTGNATTWRQVGNNHHFELAIKQISAIL